MIRSLLAPLSALALTSCFVQPGAFESAMTVNRDGSFDFQYSGEIVAFDPALLDELDGSGALRNDPDFDAALATCYGEPREGYLEVRDADEDAPELIPDADGEEDIVQPRPCTAEEIATERAERTDRMAARAKGDADKAEFLRLLGGIGDGSDDSNREIARRLNEQRGWSDVTYVGRGVWTGSYRVSGRMDVGFVFPLLPATETITPFVRLVPLADGRVRVDAPALSGVLQRMSTASVMTGLMGLGDKNPMGSMPQPKGTFTLVTDAEVLTNNTTDGPVADGARRRLVWTIGAGLKPQPPEALLRL